MSVEIKIYFINIFIVLLLLAQSVSRTQTITSITTSVVDTTSHQIQHTSKSSHPVTDNNLLEDDSADSNFASLVLSQNQQEKNQQFTNGNTFKPIPLSQLDEIITGSNNLYPLQMIDGTYWLDEPDLNYGRLLTVFGGMLTVDMIAYMYQREVWYREETTSFHTLDFNDDMKKWQYMDKIGHFTDAYFVSDLSSKLYRWSGLSGNSSVWYGALTGMLWTLQIEISDGFMSEWGFSWGDMLANTMGAGFFVLQQFNYDLLGGIQPKFSWHKSDAWKEDKYYRDPGGLIEDYEGITFWLTVNIQHYIPENWKKGYPGWLAPFGIAFGYGAKGIAGNPWGGRKEFFIGMDIDLRKIPILDESGFFRFLKSELNFLRLPLPTIRISQSGIWYGFYF